MKRTNKAGFTEDLDDFYFTGFPCPEIDVLRAGQQRTPNNKTTAGRADEQAATQFTKKD